MRPLRLLPLALLLATPACGGDDDPATADAGPPDAAPGPDAPTSECPAECRPTQGCLDITVVRAADDTALPWVVDAENADGAGTLVLSVRRGTTTALREAIADQDFTAAAASYNTGPVCVVAATLSVDAFLDDDGDALETDFASTDPLDACTTAPTTVSLLAGKREALTLTLAQACAAE